VFGDGIERPAPDKRATGLQYGPSLFDEMRKGPLAEFCFDLKFVSGRVSGHYGFAMVSLRSGILASERPCLSVLRCQGIRFASWIKVLCGRFTSWVKILCGGIRFINRGVCFARGESLGRRPDHPPPGKNEKAIHAPGVSPFGCRSRSRSTRARIHLIRYFSWAIPLTVEFVNRLAKLLAKL